MTDREFYRVDQELWYAEFVDAEVYEIREHTNHHDEFFVFEDIPF